MKVLDRKVFDEELGALLKRAEDLIPNEVLPDLPYGEWHSFELELWQIGETIRQFVAENGRKFNADQIERILNICLDKRAGRGRQSFVLLLGRKTYSTYAGCVVRILDDTDVDGQVIDTLYKMCAGQYVELVTLFLDHDKTWIGNLAKKYVQKYR